MEGFISWFAANDQNVKKLTIVPCLPHLWSEDGEVFPHDRFPYFAHLSLSLQDRTIPQLQDEVGQFLLSGRIVWRLRGSGNDGFPDPPELRLDF